MNDSFGLNYADLAVDEQRRMQAGDPAAAARIWAYYSARLLEPACAKLPRRAKCVRFPVPASQSGRFCRSEGLGQPVAAAGFHHPLHDPHHLDGLVPLRRSITVRTGSYAALL